MRQGLALVSLFACAIALGNVTANAEPPKAPAKPKDILRDPANKRGISPYMEAVVKGEKAFVARDVPGATAAFQEAMKMDPTKALAFYRMGEVEADAGKLDDADKLWEAAVTKAGDESLKAKVLFCIADLRERQQKWSQAKDAWQAYGAFLDGNKKAKGFPGSGTERIMQVERRMKLEVDYGAVKERIEQRLKIQEKEARDNAMKDKLNK